MPLTTPAFSLTSLFHPHHLSLPPFVSHHFLTLDLSQTSEKVIDIVRRSTQTLVEKRGAFKALVAAVRLRSRYRKMLESALGWRGLGKIRRRCELVCEFVFAPTLSLHHLGFVTFCEYAWQACSATATFCRLAPADRPGAVFGARDSAQHVVAAPLKSEQRVGGRREL